MEIILLALAWAFLFALSGRVLDYKIHPILWLEGWKPKELSLEKPTYMKKHERTSINLTDGVAHALMGLSLTPWLGLYSLVAVLGISVALRVANGKWLPWDKMPEWFPVGTHKEKLKITGKNLIGYTWKGLIFGASFYPLGVTSCLLATLAFTFGVSFGYLIGSYIQERGDLEGKLAGGALWGALIGIIA